MPRTYCIKTYGCAMNFADADKLASVLEAAGYQSISGSEYQKAEMILVITCVVRQNAEDRAAGFITSLKGAKEKNPGLKIGICGCLVTEPGRDLRKQFPHVDFFIPPNSPDKLAEWLGALTGYPSPSGRGGTGLKVGQGEGLVCIAHGCDNFCSYCVVPYVRGRETSRPMDEVLAEVKTMIEQGVTDITLLGQNVNSYKPGLENLLINIHQFVIHNSEFVIRFLTSHPKDMSDEIIETVAKLPYVAKEFLLPLQSGDDEILAKMNRGYTLAHFTGRVRKIRSLLPRARVTTDILVGFPGETEEQFQSTLNAVEELKFDEVHMFAYSSRPMTAAAKLPGQLPEEIKQARLQRLIGTVRRVVKKPITA